MSLAATVSAMAAAGCSAEQIAAVVRVEEDARAASAEARRVALREGNRSRQAAKRARDEAEIADARNGGNSVTRDIGNGSNDVTSRDKPLQAVTERDAVPPEVFPQENNQPPFLAPSSECVGGDAARNRILAQKADEFYRVYPKKVDPKDVKARFIRLAKSGVDPDEMISAGARYAEAQRLAGTEKRFIPSGAVWLNRGSYESEDLPEPRAGPVGAGPPRLGGQMSRRLRMQKEIFDEYAPDSADEAPAEPPLADASGGGRGVVYRIGGPR